MGHIEHEMFERKVMNMLLEGTDLRLKDLKKQYLHSVVIKREFTGRGFFTEFHVPTDLVADSYNGRIDDLRAIITNDAGDHLKGDYLFFILYITKGKIDTLECFSTTKQPWDYSYNNTVVEYCYDNHREYELIQD